jgi:hypothetical protein
MPAVNPMLRPSVGFTLLIVFALIFAVDPVTAITVTNPKIMTDVSPGMTYHFSSAVSIASSDPASDYLIDVLGFGQSKGGAYIPLTAEQDTSPYSARTFVSIDPPLIHLEPGQRQAFDVTVTIPQTVGEGGRYALIYIHPAATPGGQSSFLIAVNMPVMLTVKGTALTHTGSITNLDAGETVAGKPISIQTTLKNTGNHHYYDSFVNVTVTDTGGNVVATASTNPSIFALIPGNEMIIKTSIASLPGGTYTVTSDAKVGTTLLDTKTASITIGEPGTPAPTQTVTEAPTLVPTEALTQAVTQTVSEVPTAPMTIVTTEESPVTPGTIATRAPLSILSVTLALAALSGILVLRRRN